MHFQQLLRVRLTLLAINCPGSSIFAFYIGFDPSVSSEVSDFCSSSFSTLKREFFYADIITGCLLRCANDAKHLLMHSVLLREGTQESSKDCRKSLVSLMEPSIEYIIHHIFENVPQVTIESKNLFPT